MEEALYETTTLRQFSGLSLGRILLDRDLSLRQRIIVDATLILVPS